MHMIKHMGYFQKLYMGQGRKECYRNHHNLGIFVLARFIRLRINLNKSFKIHILESIQPRNILLNSYLLFKEYGIKLWHLMANNMWILKLLCHVMLMNKNIRYHRILYIVKIYLSYLKEISNKLRNRSRLSNKFKEEIVS